MPRKPDLRLIDRVVAEYGLSREQRRLLHDELARRKIGGDLVENEIREAAREIRDRYPNK